MFFFLFRFLKECQLLVSTFLDPGVLGPKEYYAIPEMDLLRGFGLLRGGDCTPWGTENKGDKAEKYKRHNEVHISLLLIALALWMYDHAFIMKNYSCILKGR